jgi:hypothetical protein
MRSVILLNSLLCMIILSLSHCTTIQKKIYGSWQSGLAILTLSNDGRFSYVKKGIINDTLKEDTLTGKWELVDHSIFLKFLNKEDEKLFGGCNSITVSKKFLQKTKLVRQYNCLKTDRVKPVFFIKEK